MKSLLPAIAMITTFGALGEGPAGAPQSKPSAPRTRNVAIVVHEGVELLDFAGPGEVFEAAAGRGAVGGVPWFRVFTVAPAAGPVVSQGFVTVTPKYSIADCPKPDILVIPGGDTDKLLNDAAFMAWVRKVAPETETMFSVCTGAFVLARTGQLDGLSATTHWGSLAGLKQSAPKTTVRENVRFVDNGRVVTTAGVSAGIDGALHVVAKLLGRTAADQTARYMEYRWAPDPEAAAKYSQLNPQLDAREQSRQQARADLEAKRWPEAVKALRALADQDANDEEAWDRLGYALQAMGKLDEAIAIQQRVAATFPRVKAKALYNIACAYAVKGDAEKAIDALGRAVDAGWSNRPFTERDDDLKALRAEPRYAALLDKMKPAPRD